MNRYEHKYIHLLSFLITISLFFLFFACSPKLSYNVKSFLFDGVPNPYEIKPIVKNNNEKFKVIPLNDNPAKIITRNEFYFHPPYEKRECINCHNRNSMGKPKMPLPDLCYQCHEDFNKTYEKLHGPVASGYCTKCHSPHKSKLKKLLLRPKQETCLNCHNTIKDAENKIHANIGLLRCITCHDPHGSSNEFMLQPKTCYNCHDNFEKKFKFLHGPVASNNCYQCHGTHQTKTTKLLLKNGRDLCLSCHNSKTVLANKVHLTIKTENCTKCHNPHGGNTPNMLLSIN